MRKILFLLAFLPTLFLQAQNSEVVAWIDKNAIPIQDVNPDTPLLNFSNQVPKSFSNARIFGFGEATHHGKEFFDIKAKFFKYLVQNHGVKVFILEDSYTAESKINEWISGGEVDAQTIANNFSIPPWACMEVISLLAWMREYNLNQPREDQIKFYGMDIQHVQNINHQLRQLVQQYNLPVSEELLQNLDESAEKKMDFQDTKGWADARIPKLDQLKEILETSQKNLSNSDQVVFNSALRALNYLIQYTEYIQNSYSQVRDEKMFENVQWIVENTPKNEKIFIWAHNEHINNQGFGNYTKRKIYNLGRHLKEFYTEDYYSVGFDFGSGTLRGYVPGPDNTYFWKNFELDQPFSKTYAETLNRAKEDVYFIDLASTLKSPNTTQFFEKKSKQLVLGGPGYNPDRYYLFDKKFAEMYDGLIFVKNISPPTYMLSLD